MFKLYSMLMLGASLSTATAGSAAACDCDSGQARVAAPTATARASRAPTATARLPKAPAASAQNATAQNGRQTIRRYSVAPAPSTRAPAARRSRGGSGQSWNATKKVLGY